jgi:hypothetical protein
VDAVHDGRAVGQELRAVEQLDRRAAVLGPALVQLARLLVGVDVADETVGVGVGGDLAQPAGGNGADAVGGDADVEPARAQLLHAREVVVDRRVAEARMAAARVGGGQQHDREAGRRGGVGHRERHRVRLLVRRAVGAVVNVVELADGTVAGRRHLAVDAARDVVHARGVEPLGERVHALAPAPEIVVRALAALPDPAQVALEGVRVHVRHRRDRELSHSATFELPATPVSSSAAASSPFAATAASSSDTSSSGEWLIPVALRTSTIPAGR